MLNKKIKEADEEKEKVAGIHKAQIEMLERLSGLTAEEAKEYLLRNVEDEVRHEAAIMIKEIETQAKEEADKLMQSGTTLDVARHSGVDQRIGYLLEGHALKAQMCPLSQEITRNNIPHPL